MSRMNVKEAAEKWGISVRRVQEYCRTGRVDGAQRLGSVWTIPVDAKRPDDYRTNEPKNSKFINQPLIRKSPLLDMTDLYAEPGTADKAISALKNYPESQVLFEAQIAYSKGDIDKVLLHVQEILDSHSGFFAVQAGGMLLALAALWKGDVYLWKKARLHLLEVPVYRAEDEDLIALSLACIDSVVRKIDEYPSWFTRGDFSKLPSASHPAAKVFYARYLLVYAQELAKGGLESEDVKGIGLVKYVPYTIEPLITQAMLDKTVIPEIYLRILCAIAYHQSGQKDLAVFHLDKAIDLALPDGLIGILAEHRRQLDYLLDERLELKDKEAFKKYKVLHQQLLNGWTKIHNAVLDRKVSVELTIREREISRLASFGLTNQEISDRLHISLSSVKKAIYDAMNKTGVNRRDELKDFI